MSTAIISVYRKEGLEDFLNVLFKLNYDTKIISSGGTARKIEELGYPVTEVSDYTGFPESPGGLVKTLHPKIHAGILLDPEIPEERKYLEENGIKPIDMVVCNLYPFEETVKKKVPYEEIIEMIDIGGPTLVRAAAKGALRHGKVFPVIDPKDYNKVIEDIILEDDVSLKNEVIKSLAYKAFEHTYEYDKEIKNWLAARRGVDSGNPK